MLRVLAIDVLQCPRCKASPMRILAAIQPPATTQAILNSLGQPTRAPPIAPAQRTPTDWTLAEPRGASKSLWTGAHSRSFG